MSYVIPPLVTEHEPGPDDDCVFCSGLMQYLALHPGAAPATHTEAVAIRTAAGLGPGPASSLNLIVGERNRYHWQPSEIPRGSASILASLTPGHSATASGHPIDAAVGSPFRHWLGAYAGGHRVYVARMDALERVYLLDPEAPDGYAGEWASLSDLAAFTKNGSTHTVAPLAEASMGLALTLPAVPVAGTVTIPLGTDTIRVSDGGHYKLPQAATRPGYAMSLAAPLSGPGYIIDVENDTEHFVRAAGVTFTPSAGVPATPLLPGIYKVG